jgi:hypothetical protein
MGLKKADKIEEVYSVFQSKPLKISDLKDFYKNTTEARGKNPRRRFARILKTNQDSNQHILFVGYRGCGKSTELNHLQKDLQEEFLVLNYSIQEELDPIHVNYIELFIVTMERLFSVVKEKNLKVSKAYLTGITDWIKSKEIEEIRVKYNIGVETDVGVEGALGIPYLQKFFAKFKASAKSSKSLKETLKKNVEPKLSDLINYCNDLIQEVRLELHKIDKTDLLLIIEDLDKIPPNRAEELFFNHSNQLTQIKTNVIYTFPIALYYHMNFNTIKPHFTDIHELPMIKVSNKNGTVNKKGIQTMKAIIEARMDTENLISDLDILNQMINYSGGCLRDLFLMLVEAAENALDYGRTKIEDSDMLSAFQKLKNEYENNVTDYIIDNEILVEAKEFYRVLTELAKNSNKTVENTFIVSQLRQNLSILGYNGEKWYDVHPIMKEILKERGFINGE